MIRKTPLASGKKLKVTFEVPAEEGAEVFVVGDFNEWKPDANPLKRRKKDGVFAGSLTLDAGRTYEFRYLLNGSRWLNDPDADGYRPNGLGEDNSVLAT